jgi:hypothetical protein
MEDGFDDLWSAVIRAKRIFLIGFLRLARIFHTQHGTPTGRSAGMLPALTIRTAYAGNMPALRRHSYEISGLAPLKSHLLERNGGKAL